MRRYQKVGGPGGAERIHRQAELLATARHPGVVELVGVEGSADRPVLVTVEVEGPTLAAPMPLAREEVAGLVAALAATLADLHDLGIVHGAVTPEHVLVGAAGPVLCGFGAAGRIGEAGPGGDELHPSADVAALGRLLRLLATGPDARPLRRIAEAATGDDPAARPTARAIASDVTAAVPGARLPAPAPGPAPGPTPGPLSGGNPPVDLRSLLAGARTDGHRFGLRRGRRPSPEDRVTATAAHRPLAPPASGALLGTELGGGADPRRVPAGTAERSRASDEMAGREDIADRPSPRMPGGRPPPAPAPGPRRRVPVRSAALVGAVAAVVAVGLLSAAPWASSRAATPRPTVLPTTAVPTTVSVSSTALAPASSVPAATPTSCSVPASVLVADVDGDGCLDPLRYADGVLEAPGVRWALGRTGDQVATGDWSCRGSRTVVLLRPSTGEVFRFDGWAVGTADSVTGTAVATVPGGQAVRAADVDHDGCHELVVERGELPPQVVRLPRPRP